MKFDKIIASKLRDEINEALKAIGEKYDISINAGSCSFSETEMNYKLRVMTNDQDVLKEERKANWDRHCVIYGFQKDDLGKVFTSQGQKYEIDGFNFKRTKYSLIAKKLSDGKKYCFVAEQVLNAIKVQSGATAK